MTPAQIFHNARFGSKPTLLLAAVLLAALGGCQTAAERPAIALIDPVKPAPVPVPTVAPVNMRDVTWKVYNVAQLETLIAEQKAKGDTKFVLMALTPKGYENLSLNLSDLERYIREQKQVTLYLKRTLDARSAPSK